MYGSERGSAILEHLATQYARGVTAENQNHSMAFSDGGWTRTKPWACYSRPDRTGGCSAARPPAVDAPLHIRDGWGAMRSLRAGDSAVRCFLAAKRVCGGRACALGIRCDCVALQRAAAPSCWLQARRVQRAHRESNTGWAAGCNRIFNQGPPARRPGSAPAGVPRPGSAALRPVRLAAPRGELAAGGETTEESGVHSSMRPGAGSNSRCEFK